MNMKIVEINCVSHGSTGRIMLDIAKNVRNTGGEAYTFSGEQKGKASLPGHTFFGSQIQNLMHRVYSVTTGISGVGSASNTRRLLNRIKEINPDIIHLHNLHGWYVNVPMLFDFIRKSHIQTVWTLHDCWGFTAQCSHFTIENCTKWMTGCYSCPRYKVYPYTFVDKTPEMWGLKKQWMTNIENLTLVTPSIWLKDLVKQSFLGAYDVRVINNGVDLGVFRPTESNFRDKNGLKDQKIILGVASGWTDRKGLDVFIELSKRLSEAYKIVLVGTDDKVDKILPSSILSIHRTSSQKELAEIYTAADVFFNPTREENFPTVNIEALACGTPVVSFDTGGSKEIFDASCGAVVIKDDYDDMMRVLTEYSDGRIDSAICVRKAQGYDSEKVYQQYINLYIEKGRRMTNGN